MIQYNAALVNTLVIESSVWSPLLNGDFFLPQKINGTLPVYYSHMLVTVVKEFIKQDEQITRTLDNSL